MTYAVIGLVFFVVMTRLRLMRVEKKLRKLDVKSDGCDIGPEMLEKHFKEEK